MDQTLFVWAMFFQSFVAIRVHPRNGDVNDKAFLEREVPGCARLADICIGMYLHKQEELCPLSPQLRQ